MDVVKAPDQKLRVKTRPVKKIAPALLQTLKDMIKLTKTFKDPEGVGLASTQVGLNESFFVARLDSSSSARRGPSKPSQRSNRWKNYGQEFMAIINPQILFYSKATRIYFEGCLSVPTVWGEVKRHSSIKVSYQDSAGQNFIKTLKGIPAWIFQHEVDHLNGILFTQRVLEQKGKFYKFTGKDKTGTDTFEEIAL
ncbi:peptide deformylase [Candidatus Daviesbacteria bacterium]|nr:peptide deformylase [Candidatus Daviesbacteria bacterium]